MAVFDSSHLRAITRRHPACSVTVRHHLLRRSSSDSAITLENSGMSYVVRYYYAGDEIDSHAAASLEDAHRFISEKALDFGRKTEVVIIFRISPSGTEELEESRKM